MDREPIPEDVRRFILTSIPSVPYLEAMLLLRVDADKPWDAKRVAQRLYLNEKAVEQLLADLCSAQILVCTDDLYRYQPASDDLRDMIGRVARVYARNLVGITDLIHSEMSKKAQQFADAFKWRKD